MVLFWSLNEERVTLEKCSSQVKKYTSLLRQAVLDHGIAWNCKIAVASILTSLILSYCGNISEWLAAGVDKISLGWLAPIALTVGLMDIPPVCIHRSGQELLYSFSRNLCTSSCPWPLFWGSHVSQYIDSQLDRYVCLRCHQVWKKKFVVVDWT